MDVIIQDRRSHLKAEYHHQSKLSWQIWVIYHVILIKRLKRICNKRFWKFLLILPEQVTKISPINFNGIYFSITQITWTPSKNCYHWLHWKLSKWWQFPMLPVMKILTKWGHFSCSVCSGYLWWVQCLTNVSSLLSARQSSVPPMTIRQSFGWPYHVSALGWVQTMGGFPQVAMLTRISLLTSLWWN